MAHYAFLDEHNVVVQVIAGKNENDGDFEQLYGDARNLTCKRTSYNTRGGTHLAGGTPFRKNYAGIGFIYDPERDAFIPPQPYPSWTLNELSCLWEPPTPKPKVGAYKWDEDSLDWVKLAK